MRPRGLISAVLILTATRVVVAPPARAAGTTVILDYQVAAGLAGCPDEREFRLRVARQLGHDPFRLEGERRVVVQIARKDLGFEGDVLWTEASGAWVGERHLSSRRPDCHDIANSLAFLVAVQVQLLETLNRPPAGAASSPTAAEIPQPASEATAPAPPPPPQREPPPPVEPEPTVRATPPSPPAPPHTPRLSVALGPAVGMRLGPSPTWMARLTIEGRRGPVSVELGLDAGWPAELRQDDRSGFALTRLGGSAALCGHVRVFAACAVGAGGMLRAQGVGVDAPASPHGWFGQAGARLAARRQLGDRFHMTARADGLVMISPWTVQVNTFPYWTTPRLGAVLGIDLGASFF